jgi:hypothetical protein
METTHNRLWKEWQTHNGGRTKKIGKLKSRVKTGGRGFAT